MAVFWMAGVRQSLRCKSVKMIPSLFCSLPARLVSPKDVSRPIEHLYFIASTMPSRKDLVFTTKRCCPRQFTSTPVGRLPWESFILAERSEEHTSELQSHLNIVC